MNAALAELLDFNEKSLILLILVFVRVGAVVALMPGLGEMFVPARVKLVGALVYTIVLWPNALRDLATHALELADLPILILAEALAGLVLGAGLRLLLWAVQTAGSIIAQSSSLSQIFGPGAAPDPLPAVGNLLVITAITLALVSGLHVSVAAALIHSYQTLPIGQFPIASDTAEWFVHSVSASFSLSFSLSASFLLIFFLINVAFGSINRAMPALMVSFIGAPLLTGGALLLLLMLAPRLIQHWQEYFDYFVANPFGPNR